MRCLDTIRQLTDELAHVHDDPERQREVTETAGQALDAARHVGSSAVHAVDVR